MNKKLFWFLFILLVALGIGIRLYDITEPPMSTRSLHGAVIARGMYYEMAPGANPERRDQAIAFMQSTAVYEPPILEWIVAWSYRLLGREVAWLAGLYNALLWVAGGVALFALARRMYTDAPAQTPIDLACLVALGYYLLHPFGVAYSRSFQADPGMVVWTIFAFYALYRWSEKRSWQLTLLGGLLAGLAILVKVTAVFILAPVFAALALYEMGLKGAIRSLQVWAIALLMVIPTLTYTFVGSQAGHASTYFQNTTLALLYLAIQPSFYISWLHFLQTLINFPTLLLAFFGMLISPPRARLALLSIWVGYILYGWVFPYQIGTHDYYHLRLLPVVALSLVPVAQALWTRIESEHWFWKLGFVALAILGMAYPLWVSYFQFSKYDNRQEAVRWQEIGEQLPTDGKVLALTQDYGFPLMYYGWRKVPLWPISSEQNLRALRNNPKKFDQMFSQYTKEVDYFAVTYLEDWEQQPELKERLLSEYPLLVEQADYLLFDLTPE